jgi:hypothetical protein
MARVCTDEGTKALLTFSCLSEWGSATLVVQAVSPRELNGLCALEERYLRTYSIVLHALLYLNHIVVAFAAFRKR